MSLGIVAATRKQVSLGLLMLGVSLVFLTAACSEGLSGTTETRSEGFSGPTETRDDSFVVGDSPTVAVNGGNGRIVVTPGTDGTVRVQATLRKPDEMTYEVTQTGDTISVEAKEKSRSFFGFRESPGADIEITAPSNTRVELRTSNGSVEVRGMHQSGTVHTGNGAVVMEDVVGDFDINTGNGAVTIAQASGTFDVGTGNGRIEFDGELVPGGNNRMTSGNGGVEIKLRGTPSVKLDASTVNGSVVTELPILTTSVGNKRHLVGTIGVGLADLLVRTGNGSVMVQ